MPGRSRRSNQGRSSAIYKGRRKRRGSRRMASRRRGAPVLRVSAGLVLAAGLLMVWLWRVPRPHRTPDPGPPEVVTLSNTWRAGPGEVVAFADTMARQSVETLAGLGIPRDVIEVNRLQAARGSTMRWEVTSRVPEDVPLALCNLWLTRTARRLGGEVLEGREDLHGGRLSMLVGLEGDRTTLVTLRRTPTVSRTAGRIALIVDDCGYQSRTLIDAFCDIDYPLTFSVFPDERETIWTAERAARAGHGVMVHLPMEPNDYPKRDPGQGAIFVAHPYDQIRQITRHALTTVPHAQGVNNHMGSRVTQDRRVIGYVLEEVDRQGYYFVDSATSSTSVAYDVSVAMGIPSARNVGFVDLETDADAIEHRLRQLAMRARQSGTAVGIAHARSETRDVLARVIPDLAAEGFEFVTAAEAVR